MPNEKGGTKKKIDYKFPDMFRTKNYRNLGGR